MKAVFRMINAEPFFISILSVFFQLPLYMYLPSACGRLLTVSGVSKFCHVLKEDPIPGSLHPPPYLTFLYLIVTSDLTWPSWAPGLHLPSLSLTPVGTPTVFPSQMASFCSLGQKNTWSCLGLLFLPHSVLLISKSFRLCLSKIT